MLRFLSICVWLSGCLSPAAPALQPESLLDSIAKRYLEAYPDHIIGYAADSLIWRDSSRIALDPDRDRAIQVQQVADRLMHYLGPLPARHQVATGMSSFFIQLLLESYASQGMVLPKPALDGPDATFPGTAVSIQTLQNGDWVGLRRASDSLPTYAFVTQTQRGTHLIYHATGVNAVVADSSWLPGQIAWAWRPLVYLPPGRENQYADTAVYARLLAHASLKQQLLQAYPLDYIHLAPNYDPGRLRNEAFFRRMYGGHEDSVKSRLDTVIWLPGVSNAALYVTRTNGISDRIRAISDSLLKLPHLHTFLDKPAGAFAWRPIAGTDRLSMHSFGIALDINVKHAHYWRWDHPGATAPSGYHNDIPLEIVRVFEAFGFIWGGKWAHYDTMHFEYRPELCPVRVCPKNVRP